MNSRRYTEKPGLISGSWVVVDKTTGEAVRHFDTRKKARACAKEMNQPVSDELVA